MSERVQWVEDLTTGVDRWKKEKEGRKSSREMKPRLSHAASRAQPCRAAKSPVPGGHWLPLAAPTARPSGTDTCQKKGSPLRARYWYLLRIVGSLRAV